MASTIWKKCNTNGDGQLNYTETADCLKHSDLPEATKKQAAEFAIQNAVIYWKGMKKFAGSIMHHCNTDGNGYLDYNDLKGVYSGKKHPDVISGKKTEQ